jgi:hypothetical protein
MRRQFNWFQRGFFWGLGRDLARAVFKGIFG